MVPKSVVDDDTTIAKFFFFINPVSGSKQGAEMLKLLGEKFIYQIGSKDAKTNNTKVDYESPTLKKSF